MVRMVDRLLLHMVAIRYSYECRNTKVYMKIVLQKQ